MSAPPLNSPVDLSHHFSESAKNHTPSSIKKFYKFFQIPGIGNLAGGTSHMRHSSVNTPVRLGACYIYANPPHRLSVLDTRGVCLFTQSQFFSPAPEIRVLWFFFFFANIVAFPKDYPTQASSPLILSRLKSQSRKDGRPPPTTAAVMTMKAAMMLPPAWPPLRSATRPIPPPALT